MPYKTTRSLLITLLLTLCISFLLLDSVTYAFGGGGFGGDEFQPNPFLTSSEERIRAVKKQQKLEANRLIEDPRPATIRKGPPSDYKFDQQLPLSVGDMVPVNDNIKTTLDDLVRTPYFRYYKVNLHSECPYWAMNRMCTSGGGCNVCECTENEIPKPWRIDTTDPIAQTDEKDLFNHNEQLLNNWSVDVWSDAEKEQTDKTATYVNLLENLEGNTGYSGEEPRRIWDAIYNENCFARIGHNNVSDMCFEDRLMYRLISGLHSSISAHVFKNWKLDSEERYQSNQFLWNMLFTTQQHNLSPEELDQLMHAAPGTPEADKFKKMIESDNKVLERINNLFFTLEMLLESVSTLNETDVFAYTPELTPEQIKQSIIINTGNYQEDLYTAKLLRKLINDAHNRVDLYTTATTDVISESLVPPPTMHTTFATLDQAHIDNMRHLFHNVSIIMNCVGCEKCRIWSKLNILGISTGLKLASSQSTKNTQMMIGKLQRNEIIALVNTVNSFSEAVHFISSLSIITPTIVTPKVPKPTPTTPTAPTPPKSTESSSTAPTETTVPSQPKDSGKKHSKDLSKGQKVIVIVMFMITAAIVYYSYSNQSADTFAQLEKFTKQTSNGKTRNIPLQQLDRIQRQQLQQQLQQDTQNVHKVFNNNNNKNNENDITSAQKSVSPSVPGSGKPKNRKMD